MKYCVFPSEQPQTQLQQMNPLQGEAPAPAQAQKCFRTCLVHTKKLGAPIRSSGKHCGVQRSNTASTNESTPRRGASTSASSQVFPNLLVALGVGDNHLDHLHDPGRGTLLLVGGLLRGAAAGPHRGPANGEWRWTTGTSCCRSQAFSGQTRGSSGWRAASPQHSDNQLAVPRSSPARLTAVCVSEMSFSNAASSSVRSLICTSKSWILVSSCFFWNLASVVSSSFLLMFSSQWSFFSNSSACSVFRLAIISSIAFFTFSSP
mmetsp:Transcript_40548/g.91284  ORF Transcript_40548/g.91284 Transcript_40548/m.91284 type:complete len:262 (-) Transcript_40548:1346-2131(-)